MKILKNVTIIMVVGFFIATAFGCKKSNKYVDQLADIEKKACACADKTCADAAFKDFMTVVADMKKTEAKVSDDDGQKLGTHTANIVKCIMKNGVSPLSIQQDLQKYK
jgi:hypothetical protein